MKSKKPSAYDRFMALSDVEKQAELARFDHPVSLAESRPLRLAERRKFETWQKKARAGRPKVGQGAAVISLSIERSLLSRADRYARKHKLTRAALFAKAVKAILPGAA